MSISPSSAYYASSPTLVEPSRHADCIYRTVTIAAMLLLLASLWVF